MDSRNNPTALVIFGGTGDLSRTKLLPALLDLYAHDLLPSRFCIIGFARGEHTSESYRAFVEETLLAKDTNHDLEIIKKFCSLIRYRKGDLTNLPDYEAVADDLRAFDAEIGQCTSKLFYLAVSPSSYGVVFEHIAAAKLMDLCEGELSWSRLLVEKPFGTDLESARSLEKKLGELFDESEIYRIDHYLAKDAIENILSLRFANFIFESSWDRGQIEKVHLKLYQSIGIESRGAFFDPLGALRDVGGNHMLQMLALVAMDNPESDDVEAVRAKRLEPLQALRLGKAMRGQYEGYRESADVNPESDTDTYFMIEAFVDNDRWKGVPFYLESGKALAESRTEIVIYFKNASHYACENHEEVHGHGNVMTLTLSPKQRFTLSVWVKRPGFDVSLERKDLILEEYRGDAFRSPEAYEKVLFDCIEGNQSRFVSGEEVDASWKFITPIIEGWKDMPLHMYAPGSEGPNDKLYTP